MKHIVVDLEMNNIRKKNKARKICTNETIEIGAVMLGENMQEISSFRTYVKPEYNECIVPKIRHLTGITDAKVSQSPKFREAFHMFTNWCFGTGDEISIYAWSDADHHQICKEIILKNYQLSDAENDMMEHAWHDFQKQFDNQLGFHKQISLKLALEMAGVEFNGRQHSALDDARNTAELFHIFQDQELYTKTLGWMEAIMKPTTLGLSLGNAIEAQLCMK